MISADKFPSLEPPGGVTIRGWVEAALLAVGLTTLQFVLQWRYGFGLADEGLLWYLSQRALLGEVSLLDWFGYDPGRYAWSAFWFRLLGNDGLYEQLLANAAFGALGFFVAQACLVRARIAPVVRVGVAVLLAIALAFPRHKVYEQSLSLLLVGACFFVLLDPTRRGRWLVFGAASGLAAWFGRNSGVYFVASAMLCAAFLAWQRPRGPMPWLGCALAFAAGVVLGYLPMIWLVLFRDGFETAFLDSIYGVVKGKQISLPIPWPWRVAWPFPPTIDAMRKEAFSLLCIIVPLSYASALLASARQREATPSPARLLLVAAALAGLPYLHHAFDRAGFGHLAQGFVPFIVLLGVFAVTGPGKSTAPTPWPRAVFVATSVALLLLAWIPTQPLVAYLRAAGSHVPVSIAGRTFFVDPGQAQVMQATRVARDGCGDGKSGFLIAPSYPGIYAYLHAKAPFWETFYLYQRPAQMQLAHIAALSSQRVHTIVINPVVTIDSRPEYRLGATYPLLVQAIERDYTHISIAGLPADFHAYRRAQWCQP